MGGNSSSGNVRNLYDGQRMVLMGNGSAGNNQLEGEVK